MMDGSREEEMYAGVVRAYALCMCLLVPVYVPHVHVQMQIPLHTKQNVKINKNAFQHCVAPILTFELLAGNLGKF